MSFYEISLDKQIKTIEWQEVKCDKFDYMISVFCGFSAGVIDSVFVEMPGQGKLGQLTDKTADDMVQKIANILWKGDARSSTDGKPRKKPDTLEKAIAYLEQSFPVNYDARYGKDLFNSDGFLSMSPRNHHLMSLSHSPDIIGMIFSILDQFTGKASFINDGKVIRLVPVKDTRNNKVMYMQGTNFESKIFCGICNWLGHIASDLCGSSSTRRQGKTGRGAGISMPFYNLFLMMNFGDFDGRTFADIAIKIFEDGYDFRYGASMAIPVLIEEASIKIIWVLKQRYYLEKNWRDCIPSAKHADLRMMLLLGNATLCIVDGVDAAIRTGVSGGNLLSFILHLNLVAWTRIIMLVFRELRIRYGVIIDQVVQRYLSQVGMNDAYTLGQYYDRMNDLNQGLIISLKEFILKVEKEHENFMAGVDSSLNPAFGLPEQRRISSVNFARDQDVSEERVFGNPEELLEWLEKGDEE